MILLAADSVIIARKRAYEARRNLDIGAHESIDIFKALRDKEGVSLIISECKGDISGFFMRKGDVGLIFVNSARSLGHQHFAAAHEYYHLQYDTGLSGKICPIKKFDDEYSNEHEANIFASYFLMPDDALRYHVDTRTNGGKIKIQDVIHMENHFGVSHQLMLLRLKDLRLITEEDAKIMRPQIINQARKLGFSTDLYKSTESKGEFVYSDYAAIAAELLESGKISFGKYEELLMDGKYSDVLFGGEDVTNDNPDPDCLR